MAGFKSRLAAATRLRCTSLAAQIDLMDAHGSPATITAMAPSAGVAPRSLRETAMQHAKATPSQGSRPPHPRGATEAEPIGLVGQPSSAASPAYRLLLGCCQLIARLLGFRLILQGAANIPRDSEGRPSGGWIAAGVPHRTWIEPFILALLLPPEPRLVFFGDGRAIFRSPLRRAIFRAIGGVVPIWPGGGRSAFTAHVAAVGGVVDAGAIFALFPEVGPPVPVGRARPIAPGIGYFALRSGAPVVPVVFGGTDELYLGRRMVMRVLPSRSPHELAGVEAGGPLPRPESREERAAAHRIASTLDSIVAPDVAEVHRAAESRPRKRKLLRGLTGILR
jgi:1-acyl-sn-glycerol-3-phosphate acyltransferase